MSANPVREDVVFRDHARRSERLARVLRTPPHAAFAQGADADDVDAMLAALAEALDVELVLVGHVNGTTYTTMAYHARGGKAGIATGDTLPIGETYCREEITAEKPFVLGDAEMDPRYAHHPGFRKHGLRAYVGAPLVLTDGTLFGTLCGVDTRPRRIRLPAVEHLVKTAELLSARISRRLGLPPRPQRPPLDAGSPAGPD